MLVKNFNKEAVSTIGTEVIIEAVSSSLSFREALTKLGLNINHSSQWALNMWCSKSEVSTDHFRRIRANKQGYNCDFVEDNVLLSIAETATSISDICRLLGKSTTGHYHKAISLRLKHLGFDVRAFRERVARLVHPRTRKSLSNEELFSVGHQVSGLRLRKGLIKTGTPYLCKLCGLGPMWNGLPITLQVDHINGNPIDNTLDNLRFVCPNCHTQTTTFTGRKFKGRYTLNKVAATLCSMCGASIKGKGKKALCPTCSSVSRRKVARIPKDELLSLLKDNTMTGIGKMYGLSGNAIVKWCQSYGIDCSLKSRKMMRNTRKLGQ